MRPASSSWGGPPPLRRRDDEDAPEQRGKRRRSRSRRRRHREDEDYGRASRRRRGDGDEAQRRDERWRRRQRKDEAALVETRPDDKDDSVGHYEGGRGDVLASQYEILGEAGLGTFGRVVECFDRRNVRRVAIKVVRKIERYTESAAVEAEMLRDVNAAALAASEASRRTSRGASKSSFEASSVLGRYSSCPPSALCVKLLATFDYQGHFCLVFEKLGTSLYELLKLNNYRPFREATAARMTRQILEALAFLHDGMGLVHTDLKLENVLLRHNELVPVADPRDPRGEPLRVPRYDNVVVIDFGGATYDHERKSSIVNTRQYRAPEVILNVGWSTPSDLWSAGCILAELRKGELLFATHSNTEHIGLIERCVGPFPRHMLECSKYFSKYFDTRSGRSNWEEALSRDGRDHVRKMPTLDAYCGLDRDLRALLRGLLVIDPDARLSAREALDTSPMLHPSRLHS